MGILRRKFGSSLTVMVLLVLASIARVLLFITDTSGGDQYFNLVGEQVVVSGRIADDPGDNRRGKAISLDDLWIERDGDWRDLPGKIWLVIPRDSDVRRYDHVVISGVMDSGFGIYRATVNQARVIRNDHASNHDVFGWLRSKFRDSLGQVLTTDQLGLAMGLMAGDKTNISHGVLAAFSLAALTHILVASGYNLTILVRLMRRLVAKHSRALALLCSLALIFIFAGIAGWSASMERAMIVSVVSLLVWYVGRHIHPVVIIVLSSAITVLIDPSVVFGDLGWYLSFLSFAGVLILSPLLVDSLTKLTAGVRRSSGRFSQWIGERIGSIGQIICETISAQLLTLPIIAVGFGTLSTLGLLTNLVVLPIVPILMLLIFILGLVGFVAPIDFLQIVAWPVELLLDYILGVAKTVARWDFASVEITMTPLVVTLFYIALLLVIVVLWRATKHNYRDDNVIK